MPRPLLIKLAGRPYQVAVTELAEFMDTQRRNVRERLDEQERRRRVRRLEEVADEMHLEVKK